MITNGSTVPGITQRVINILWFPWDVMKSFYMAFECTHLLECMMAFRT